MTNTETLQVEFLEAVIDAGFDPADDPQDLVEQLTATARKTIAYFANRGVDAVRIDDLGQSLTFVRCSEDGIYLTNTTTSGVINSEARFDCNAKGLAWFRAVAESTV